MIYKVFKFNPETIHQIGYILVAQFDSKEKAMAYVEEKHQEDGDFFRVEKSSSSNDEIVFEHKYIAQEQI